MQRAGDLGVAGLQNSVYMGVHSRRQAGSAVKMWLRLYL